jgi:hypothetical protein
MKSINIGALQFSYDSDGYRSGMARLGPLLGAEQLAASVYEILPAQSIYPCRYGLR